MFEEDAIESAPPPAAVIASQIKETPPAEIGFQNIAAVRVAFLSAAIASMLSFLPVPLLSIVMLAAGGFFSVWLYRRRTGEFLSVRNGARIGTITGVFSFAISTVLLTVTVLSISLSGQTESFVSMIREQLQQKGFPQEMVDQGLQVLSSPAGFTIALLLAFALRFATCLGLTAIGGALGARVLSKD